MSGILSVSSLQSGLEYLNLDPTTSGGGPGGLWVALADRVQNITQLPRLLRDGGTATSRSERPAVSDNPAVTRRASGYEEVDGELFGRNGPLLAHVDQGRVGDCYFLAAVGSVVSNNPEAIRNAIVDNGDGTYSVRFYDEQLFGPKEVWITVDADLPVNKDGNLVYARGVDADDDGKLELWVPIMEKAYAKFCEDYGPENEPDGYAGISGGCPAEALYALTGKRAICEELPGGDEQLRAMLKSANEGHHVIISTFPEDSDGWVGNHAYTVVGTFVQDGELMVMLRNPWGSDEPNNADHGSNDNDGVFTVSLDELRAHADGIRTDYTTSLVDTFIAGALIA